MGAQISNSIWVGNFDSYMGGKFRQLYAIRWAISKSNWVRKSRLVFGWAILISIWVGNFERWMCGQLNVFFWQTIVTTGTNWWDLRYIWAKWWKVSKFSVLYVINGKMSHFRKINPQKHFWFVNLKFCSEESFTFIGIKLASNSTPRMPTCELRKTTLDLIPSKQPL